MIPRRSKARHPAVLQSFQLHHLLQFWIRISSSLWFVPLGIVFCAIVLAMMLIATDLAVGSDWTENQSLVFGVGASGARGMLSAIAGSMMTVASLTFSLTIATLATASSQYTSRLIRNFMRDRLNQFVLGYFVGLFAYCLVVLRTIRDGDESAFVPSLAVMGGLLLALLSIGVLIFFIHHIAESIQVGIILRRVTNETLRAINNMFPADVGEPAAADPVLASMRTAADPDEDVHDGYRWYTVSAQRFGYVQSLDTKDLLARAVEIDAVVRMSADIGSFVTSAGSLCEIAIASPPSEKLLDDLRSMFDIGAARTVEQDAAFGIRQIVDIGLKALPPGVSDTTTSVMCVEHLGTVLETLAARSIPDRVRAKDGKVRLIASGRSFDALTGLCLNQIRQSATANTAVMVALLNAIEAAGRQTSDDARRRTLSRHANLIATLARDSVTCPDDLAPVLTTANAVMAELNSARPHPA
ncbi:MAG: DUF2254 domain-containing protein [Phycisphaeraceae bacterium]|nr:MAG: DUF2254 domain-containing protein [Phycisphaeraceae bacterium]